MTSDEQNDMIEEVLERLDRLAGKDEPATFSADFDAQRLTIFRAGYMYMYSDVNFSSPLRTVDCILQKTLEQDFDFAILPTQDRGYSA